MESNFYKNALKKFLENSDPHPLVRHLQNRRVLRKSAECVDYRRLMTLQNKKDSQNGLEWRCPNAGCNAKLSVRTGSCFTGSRLSLQTIFLIIWKWCIELSLKVVSLETGVSQRIVGDFFHLFRTISCESLQITPIKLGGFNHIVEIDESCFRHSAKYGRGRKPEKEIWVFGLIDRNSEPSVSYLEVVEDRSAETLLPIIQAVCLPGTIIYSDCWAAYKRIQERLGFEHRCVNHSDRRHRFVSADGIHTQRIESYWNKCKTRLKSMKGLYAHLIPGFLNELMWRERHTENRFNAFMLLLKEGLEINN